MHSNKKVQKFIQNDCIQENDLFGILEEDNIAKKYMLDNNTIIKGEEFLGIKKLNIGGIIVITETIANNLIEEFNERQKQHIKDKTFPHKILCERREEAASLIFITLKDLVGELSDGSYRNTDRHQLCQLIQSNIQKIVEERLSWLITYSKHIIRDYYSISSNRLKIKLNYILDDGKYDMSSEDEKTKGGLILNGFLDELFFYNTELSPYINDNIGIICQVLCPSGLPRSKKWIQIDVGISFIGKRNYKETIEDALTRKSLEEIHIRVSNDVKKNANKLYYANIPNITSYDGSEIHIWEILYPDQISIIEENELNMKFCKCKKRTELINKHKIMLKNTL